MVYTICQTTQALNSQQIRKNNENHKISQKNRLMLNLSPKYFYSILAKNSPRKELEFFPQLPIPHEKMSFSQNVFSQIPFKLDVVLKFVLLFQSFNCCLSYYSLVISPPPAMIFFKYQRETPRKIEIECLPSCPISNEKWNFFEIFCP